MIIHNCDGGNVLVISSPDVFPQVDPKISNYLRAIIRPKVMVGVVSTIERAYLVHCKFEHYEEPISLVVKGWSGSGSVAVRSGQLILTSYLPGDKTPKLYTPAKGEDVIIGDLDLEEPDLAFFKRKLWAHNPRPAFA